LWKLYEVFLIKLFKQNHNKITNVCGYIGQISQNEINHEKLLNQNKNIICRGPDEKQQKKGNLSKFNKRNNFNYSFIFNRLSIIDLSSNASQPMFSEQFNTAIMFNGEIYNHKILRNDLEKENIKFKSKNSDTEVLLNGLSKYGLSFLDYVTGQFAITFLDFDSNKLFLVRDRLGQKPLFYSFKNNNLLFSSNLKSLANMHTDISVDENSVDEYISYGYISSPKTIFKDIYKVKPGEIIEIDFDDGMKIKSKKIYWEIKNFIGESKFQEDIFYEKFNNAVSLRKIADVEVASLLSGGIDSTSVVKALKETSPSVNTFSIGYEDDKYDEKYWSRIVSKKYSTNHIEAIITNNEFEKYINESIQFLDEPYADPSIVPSYVISKKISNHYKVALTGDGGDELLCGYSRIQQIFSTRKFNTNTIESIYNFYPWYFGTGNNIRKRSKNLNLNYQSYFSDEKFLYKLNDQAKCDNNFFKHKFENLKDLMLVDFNFYLSEMMMFKVDRMSMANSLEARSPFVDHNLIEYCISTNLNFLINSPKSILKDYLREDFDDSFLDRKKMGFVFNVEKWIYENLDMIKSYLIEGNTRFNNYSEILSDLSIRKSRINAQRIWKIYVLEKYLKDYFDNRNL